MRPDFNKLLVERERVHHGDHYHNYRNVKGPKGLSDDEVGGRESMKKRYNHGYDRKSFNENLNPLYGWLRSCIGKNWDKCYSDLRKTFDARSVINAHILEHLWSDVERHAFVKEDGKVYVVSEYRYGAEDRIVPINKCFKDYYVCPKDGTLKKTHKEPRRSVLKQKEAEKQAAADAVMRVIDEHNVLHLIGDVWYHFELREVPKAKISYVKPWNIDVFQVSTSYGGYGNRDMILKTWNELNQAEREKYGTKEVRNTAKDLFMNETVYVDERLNRSTSMRYNQSLHKITKNFTLYHATKATANKKQLKAAGLVK